MSGDVLSMQQFKRRKFDALLDSLPPEPSLDEKIDAVLKNDWKAKPRRPKLRVVKHP